MSKPRIIGGLAKGRSLDTPRQGTRPSPARLREALFDKLEFHERGAFLDLYSGTGAMGLEAASRGWTSTCVDLGKEAATIIRKNARALKLNVTTVQADALKYVQGKPQSFDIVFAAPPYPLELMPIFQTIFDSGIAKQDGLYIFQHPTQLELKLKTDLTITVDSRKYGSNVLTYVSVNLAQQNSA
ncbi:MAG: RsmD family RNA methyltransferase [Trueperaceae bacterium]|nr:RsmD family RNA methyltransferase [Trueperaceae bacterium]